MLNASPKSGRTGGGSLRKLAGRFGSSRGLDPTWGWGLSGEGLGFGSRVNGFGWPREGRGASGQRWPREERGGEFGQRRPRERERVSGGGGWLVAGDSQGERGGGAASTGRERVVIFGLVIIRVSYFFFCSNFRIWTNGRILSLYLSSKIEFPRIIGSEFE